MVWCFGRLAWWIYTKPGSKSTKLINIKDCTKIAANPKYIGKVSGVRYRLTTNNMMKLKDKNKV